MNFFQNIINKIQEVFDQNLSETESSMSLQQIEETLIKADLPIDLVLSFSQKLNKNSNLSKSSLIKFLKDFLLEIFLDKNFDLNLNPQTMNIILFVGVNGVGKTTSLAKLANFYKKQNYRILIAAADTFRAAAKEQLNIWATRIGLDIISEGNKPSTVIYNAISKAKSENYNLILIDTAGRLQNKKELMDELSKLKFVISKNLDEYNLETMLVLDSNTGSNALSQAKHFNEATKLDSIFLTKFDGSAKAGMIFALAQEFKIPVKFIGKGEAIEDLEKFSSDNFLTKFL